MSIKSNSSDCNNLDLQANSLYVYNQNSQNVIYCNKTIDVEICVPDLATGLHVGNLALRSLFPNAFLVLVLRRNKLYF